MLKARSHAHSSLGPLPGAPHSFTSLVTHIHGLCHWAASVPGQLSHSVLCRPKACKFVPCLNSIRQGDRRASSTAYGLQHVLLQPSTFWIRGWSGNWSGYAFPKQSMVHRISWNSSVLFHIKGLTPKEVEKAAREIGAAAEICTAWVCFTRSCTLNLSTGEG